ncbi:hypothetical protein PAPHI01_1049 [Pancytospora philotis]|nr:hypothetical protein PAPHI01_1049 [Pancytospora philotis]
MSPPSEETVASFNKLVLEYLLKMKLDKSAAAFRKELGLDDVRLNDALPTLLNWYSIFLETAEVRAGITLVPDSLNRIEGIMLKLENEKLRYSQLKVSGAAEMRPHASLSRPAYGQYSERPRAGDSTDYGPRPSAYGTGPYPQRMPGMERDAPSTSAAAEPPAVPPASYFPPLKEYNVVEMNIPYILAAHYCPQAQLLLLCAVDGKAYFYSLAAQKVEYSFVLPKPHVRQLRALEANHNIFFLVAFDDASLHLYRYANGIKEDMKPIESDTPIRSFCFGKRSIYVLAGSSTIRVYSFVGDLLKTLRVGCNVLEIEFFGTNLLLVEAASVTEFDPNMGIEVKALARGKSPRVIVKDDFAFVIFTDSVQGFSGRSPFPVIAFKSTLNVVDIDLIANMVAVCTGNETYIGNDLYPISNSILVMPIVYHDVIGCIVLGSNAVLSYFTSNVN